MAAHVISIKLGHWKTPLILIRDSPCGNFYGSDGIKLDTLKIIAGLDSLNLSNINYYDWRGKKLKPTFWGDPKV